MKKHYIVYTSHLSMEPDSAHEIHDVMCANAAMNLGYPTVMTYPDEKKISINPIEWLFPFQPQKPNQEFQDFYNVDNRLKTVPIMIPFLLKDLKNKHLNRSHYIYKYYLPFHVFPVTQVIHTRDYNCVKAAIKAKIPVIYERHYFAEQPFNPEIVNSPFFKIAITQSELTLLSLIQAGMPAEKALWMHNGFGQAFLERKPEEAQQWRNELLKDDRQALVLYSGALYPFKGVDLLIDVAKLLPNIQFALTGGTAEQVTHYRQLALDKQVENIDFLGWILPRARLVSLFQAADILAHPHCSGKSASFTNPVKFFQYIASGTPIAATEITPLMMFKSSPMIAGWCEPDSPVAFSQCIQKVLTAYPRKIDGYSENIEFAHQFTWEQRTAKILQLALA